MYQMFLIAKALQLRGAEVKILLCGSRLDGCETKSVKNKKLKDPCLNCRFNHKYLTTMYGLDFIQISDFVSQEKAESLRNIATNIASNYPQEYFYKNIDIIPMVNDSVIRYYYGAVPSDIHQLTETRMKHLTSSMIGIEAAGKIDEAFTPNIVLNNMFAYSVTEPYYKYYSKKGGAKLFSMTITPFDYHGIVINIMEFYMSSNRFLRYLEYRGNNRLTKDEKESLTQIIDARFKGQISIFKDLGCFESNHDVEKILKINRSKKNIFLFPSVYWDLGMSESGQLFNDVISWVLKTIDIVKDHDDIHLYIKPHPAEKYDSTPSLKGIEDYIFEAYPVLPENIRIILPEYKIKPYDLFPYIDLGLVYNGTLGLEMMLQNIPIVITGKAPYGRLGLAQEPQTIEEYDKILFGEVDTILPDRGDLELFAYFYLIRTNIPWNLTERAYADNFKGYTFNSLEDILPGKNKYLDHICNCILNSQNTVIEGWVQ